MDIRKELIEDLGFTFLFKDEKTGDDCTYNIPSRNKKGWFYAIVHNPSKNEVHISHHKYPPINGFLDVYIVDKLQLTTMEELIHVLYGYGILGSVELERNIKINLEIVELLESIISWDERHQKQGETYINVELNQIIDKTKAIKKRMDDNASIEMFLRFQKMSSRLFNILEYSIIGKYPVWKRETPISSITQIDFMSLRNAGTKSWLEFVQLRGY